MVFDALEDHLNHWVAIGLPLLLLKRLRFLRILRDASERAVFHMLEVVKRCGTVPSDL